MMSCSGCSSSLIHGASQIVKSKLGIGVADDATIERRRRACSRCENRRPGLIADSCRLCRCLIHDKTRMEDEECADTPPRWLKVIPNE